MKINETVRKKAIQRCKEKGITIPTFAQQINPELVPAKIKERLKNVGLWDFDPANLYRITWKNEPKERGGLFGDVNMLEIPSSITGVDARIVGLVGKFFPTGAHKVGAAFGCLVPRLVTGNFDPTYNKAVWPSTGNYCRGGAFDCSLLACTAVAILPEEMSQERFTWLREAGAEVIATPGCESNVKEIYDACWDIRKNRKDCVIFNQFDEFGNYLWHYNVTGRHALEVYDKVKTPTSRFAGYISATGSGGTLGAGDLFKERFPHVKIGAAEALQCPTLLANGFGGHRIEGIGDKHIPWIHNVRNTDMVLAIDDEATMSLLRLFNEKVGQDYLIEMGVPSALICRLPLMGISCICNLIASIKMAKWYEMDGNDVIMTIFTDSAELYQSRLQEMTEARGPYTRDQAARDHARYLMGAGQEHMKELGYHDRKAIHNLKYYTWVEQQAKETEDLNKLWDPSFWTELHGQVAEWDKAIEAFNAEVLG
jgi:cysteine synthase